MPAKTPPTPPTPRHVNRPLAKPTASKERPLTVGCLDIVRDHIEHSEMTRASLAQSIGLRPQEVVDHLLGHRGYPNAETLLAMLSKVLKEDASQWKALKEVMR